ncbi:MAG: glycosyltransferase family 2 protein [Bacteroidales bacterium]|nr:glycosyltransferase family 2 protein [Bacteroidales bacterium]
MVTNRDHLSGKNLTMDYPLVSIVTVNYDHPEVTCALLYSLRQISYPNVEIIVVDNASPNDDPAIIYQLYPEVVFIQSEKNLGFANGNNLGINVSKGEYILLLNNDTEVDPGFIEPLVRKLQSDPGIGMVSPKIRFFYAPDTIQYAGYTGYTPLTLRQFLIGLNEVDTGQYDQCTETYSIHGAAVMVPVSVIKEVGLMAEMYFLYYEEHDWAERIKRAGYKVYYVPDSLVLHKESMSTGKQSPLKTYYITRNRFLFARRNIQGFKKMVTLMYLSFFAFPKGVVSFLFDKRPDLALATMKAYFWNFIHFSDIRRNQLLK